MKPRLLALPAKAAGEPVQLEASASAPLTDAVLAALATLGLTDRQLAAVLRMPQSQLSRQKNNQHGNALQVQRLDLLPTELRDEFLDALIAHLLRARGAAPATMASLQPMADALRSVSDALEQFSRQQPALPFERRREVRRA